MAEKTELYQGGKDSGQQLSDFFGGEGGWADATSGASQLYGSSSDGTVTPGTCGINCSNDYSLYAFHTGGANMLFCRCFRAFHSPGNGYSRADCSDHALGGESLIADY